MQTPTATYFYHLDPQGSVSELSDATGNIVASYTYDGYGNVTTNGSFAAANPLLYKGQYLDSDTGLYNMRARQYDPTTGRFTQRDWCPWRSGRRTSRPTPLSMPADRLHRPHGHDADELLVHRGLLPGDQRSRRHGGREPRRLGCQHGRPDDPRDADRQERRRDEGRGEAGDVRRKAVLLVPLGHDPGRVGAGGQALANSTGEIAEAAEVGQRGGRGLRAGIAADTAGADAAAGDEAASASDFLGPLLIVVGLAVGIDITVEAANMAPSPPASWDAVGTAVGTGLGIACLAATEGLGAVACGMAVGIVSAALTEVDISAVRPPDRSRRRVAVQPGGGRCRHGGDRCHGRSRKRLRHRQQRRHVRRR